MEREKYRLERERRQKEGGGNERNEGNGKKTRTNNVLYFNPKPEKSNDTGGAKSSNDQTKKDCEKELLPTIIKSHPLGL